MLFILQSYYYKVDLYIKKGFLRNYISYNLDPLSKIKIMYGKFVFVI